MSSSEFDETRRITLKVIAGTSASLAAGSLGASGLSGVNGLDASESNGANQRGAALADKHPSVLFDLDMHIISSTGVVENSLTVKNNTRKPMHITRFRSAQIVFGQRYVSLDEITELGPVHLAPLQTRSFQVGVSPLADAILSDFVRADNCVTALNDQCVDVHLNGFLAGNDMMVVTGRQNSVDVVL